MSLNVKNPYSYNTHYLLNQSVINKLPSQLTWNMKRKMEKSMFIDINQ